jgi:hypothetical protein
MSKLLPPDRTKLCARPVDIRPAGAPDDDLAADFAYIKDLDDGKAAERARILSLGKAFTCPCGEDGCTLGRETLDAFLNLITEDSDD